MRKRTARSVFDFEKNFDLNFDEYLKPYNDVQQELQEHLYFIKNKLETVFAYKVEHDSDKSLFFITWAKNKERAKRDCYYYFRDNFHPAFTGKANWSEYLHLRPKRIPEFDKYSKEKQVPIPELLKIGLSIPCSLCGKHTFELKDYDNNRCFIIEGEGNMNSFTKGLLLCYDCKKKYFS